jgi:hypothetical protein
MLAELLDAVVGVDTHRDTREVEIALPTGVPIATCQISNDTAGFDELLAWIVDHAPGPRLAVSIERTRSYGVGLARTASAAGLLVLECEQPNRKAPPRQGQVRPDRCAPRHARRAAPIDGTTEVVGADGPVPFLDLFQGRDELVIYHHIWHDGVPHQGQCAGCTFNVWQMKDTVYLEARSVLFAVLTSGRWDEVAPFVAFMGYAQPWYSVRVWVSTRVSRPLISAFMAGQPDRHHPDPAQHDRSLWPSDSSI